MPEDEQVITAYCLERIFGKEFYRGEAMSNIDDGGYLSCIPPERGCSRAKYACDVAPEIVKNQWTHGFLPFNVDFKTRKDIHSKRRSRWLSKVRMEDADPVPIIYKFEDDNARYPCDYEHHYPEWAETTLLSMNLTSGSTIGDLNKDEVLLALRKLSSSRNPVEAFIRKEQRYNEYPTSMADEDKDRFLKALSCLRVFRSYAIKRNSKPISSKIETSNDLRVLPLDRYLTDKSEERSIPLVSNMPENKAEICVAEEGLSSCGSESLQEAYDDDDMSLSSEKTHVSESSW